MAFFNELLTSNFFTQSVNLTEAQAKREDDLGVILEGLDGEAIPLDGVLQLRLQLRVLASLVRQGYVDLSDLKLQKTQPLVSQYKFDNGTSGAYLIFGYEASACLAAVPGYPFMGMAAPADITCLLT